MTVGDNGTILSSTDSTSWNQINSGTTENLREIKYLNGLYLIVGKNRIILSSSNGTILFENNLLKYILIVFIKII